MFACHAGLGGALESMFVYLFWRAFHIWMSSSYGSDTLLRIEEEKLACSLHLFFVLPLRSREARYIDTDV